MKTMIKKLAIVMAFSSVVSTSAFAEIKTTTLESDTQSADVATVTLQDDVEVLGPKSQKQTAFADGDIKFTAGLEFYDKNQEFTASQEFVGGAGAFDSKVMANNSGQYLGLSGKLEIKDFYAEAMVAKRIGGSASHNDCNADGTCPASDAASNLSGTDWELKFGYEFGHHFLPADSRWELDGRLSFMGSKVDSGSFVQDNMTRDFDMSQNEWAFGGGTKFHATEEFSLYSSLMYGFINGDYSSVANTNSGISITEKNDISFDGSGVIFELGAEWEFSEGYFVNAEYQKKFYSVSMDSTLSAEPLVPTTTDRGISGDLEEDRFTFGFKADTKKLFEDVVSGIDYLSKQVQ